MKGVRIVTVFSYIANGLLWLLAGLVLLFNLQGAWDEWCLAGYGFYFYMAVPIISSIVSLLMCKEVQDGASVKKYKRQNTIILVASIVVTVFTLLVSCTWFGVS